VIFTPETLPDVFGPRYAELIALPIGASVALSDLGELRSMFPMGSSDKNKNGNTQPYRIRFVEVRRGSVFEGIPAGQTARLFNTMIEETPPWVLTLVPEPLQP
jgi:hypothetical protein